jgi:5-methylcytosine-specific restriction endonuclease McrA
MRSPGRICHVCGRFTPPGMALCSQHAAEAASRRAKHRRETDPNQALYSSSKWRKARRRVLERYGRLCILDTAPTKCDGRMHVHHIDHDVSNMADANLVPLCEHHHSKIETEHRRGEHGIHHVILDTTLEALRR